MGHEERTLSDEGRQRVVKGNIHESLKGGIKVHGIYIAQIHQVNRVIIKVLGHQYRWLAGG